MLLIGIDGGGSSTVAQVAIVEDGQIARIGQGEAGPSNLQTGLRDEVFAEISEAVAKAFAALEQPRTTARAACLSMAGSDREVDRRDLRQWAEQEAIAERLEIVHDALPLLAVGALHWDHRDATGIAVISGTGSFVYGQDQTAHVRCGGWGPLFGDEGSGYALALGALRAAARAADGRGPETTLLTEILATWQLDRAEDLITHVYRTPLQRPDLARLAPLVFDQAEAGDLVSRTLVARAASDLAEMIQTVAKRLRLPAPLPVVVGGSCLVAQPRLRDELSRCLDELALTHQIVVAASAAQGALQIARTMALS